MVENHRIHDSISNRENENQAQSYAVSASVLLSPNVQSANSCSMFASEFGRKQLDFSPDHIQCLCEALQQKGDIEKLATLLYNLPKSELVKSNDSILRFVSSFFDEHFQKHKISIETEIFILVEKSFAKFKCFT